MRRLVIASLATLGLIGCSGAAEQPIVNQLFAASRLHDSTTLAGFSMVELDPQKDGSVMSFSITNVTPETHKPLQLKSLAKALEDARAEDEAFNKRHDEYEQEHADVVKRVATAGRDAKLKGTDADIQVAWFKIVDEGHQVSKKVVDAKRKLQAESAVPALSVADPRNPIDLGRLDGELVSKDVTVDADVRQPNGQTTKKTYVITMQRALLKGSKGDITGRWVITDLR